MNPYNKTCNKIFIYELKSKQVHTLFFIIGYFSLSSSLVILIVKIIGF